MTWIALIVFFLLVGAAAYLGGQWGANDWYRSLRKPGFTPPNWIFPVVWPILYALMAISGWLVWRSGHPLAPVALGLWATQLLLNGFWSYIFFGRKNIAGGMADLVTLWLAIAAYVGASAQISAAAALLFCPYLAWATFAGALNWRILRLNPV